MPGPAPRANRCQDPSSRTPADSATALSETAIGPDRPRAAVRCPPNASCPACGGGGKEYCPCGGLYPRAQALPTPRTIPPVSVDPYVALLRPSTAKCAG